MRVLFVITDFRPKRAGAEVQAERLALALAERGIEVEVITRRIEGTPASEMIGPIRVTRPWSPSSERIRMLGLLPVVFKAVLASSKRFDVLHAHQGLHPSAAAVAAAAYLQKPSVVKVGNSGPRFDLTMLENWAPTMFSRRLSRYLATKTSCFVALNADIRLELGCHGVPPERIVSIPNGVSILPPQTPRKKIEARQTLGLAPHDQIITSVGNLHPKKNHRLLLEALRLMAEMGYRPSAIIVGEGPLRGELEEYSDSYGMRHQVQLVGSVSNVFDYLYASDVFVLPSRTEGLSNALLEAMSIGLPVVATDIAGNRELIENGVQGLLVPLDDAQALALSLVKLLPDGKLACSLGRTGHQRIVQHFDIREVARRYHLLYQALLDGGLPYGHTCQEIRGAQASVVGHDYQNE